MYYCLEHFFEEFAIQGWVGILKFNGFSILAILLGLLFREIISDIKNRIFDSVPIVIAVILLGVSVWCGFSPLTSPILGVRIVTIIYFLIFLLTGSFAYRSKVK